MIDYYRILEVSVTASEDEIKQAYKRLSLINHPDKTGGNEKKFVEIGAAYEYLIDDEKRSKYNIIRDLFLIDEITPTQPAGYLTTNTPSFSAAFKHQHQSDVARFKQMKPEIKEPLRKCFDATSSLPFSNFLKSLQHKENPKFSLLQFKKETLTPEFALNFFREFLKGRHSAVEMNVLLPLFHGKINTIDATTKEHALYVGIYEVLNGCFSTNNHGDTLLKSLQKISDYAIKLTQHADFNAQLIMGNVSVLFSNKRFRELYAFALHQYWISSDTALDMLRTQVFNGCDRAEEKFEQLKESYASEGGLALFDKIRLFNLIRKLEKHGNEYPDNTTRNTSQFYRDKGFLFLDWIHSIGYLIAPKVLTNTLLQAGICFQQAAREESRPAYQAADEKLAHSIYIICFSRAQQTTPDLELYINTHLLKLISQFRYPIDSYIKQLISAMEHRTYLIANIFPFFKRCQPNIEIIEQADQSLVLMRQYLHALMSCYQSAANKSQVCDHEYVTILFEVYEACLKNWYEVNIDPSQEESYRYQLMQELLRINRWTLADVNSLLMPPAVTVMRDPQAWIAPNRELSFAAQKDTQYFSTIEALELNYDSGEITMTCKPWAATDSSYSKLFTHSDIEELFRKKTTAAEFSLDKIDPDKRYHPFNKVRFKPSNLYQSELLHTMLLADYLLKFLTVGYEVQGDNPYALRSIDKFISSLPPHLKKIITEFQNAENTGEMNRFWIEAEELPVAIDDDNSIDTLKMAFNSLNMVVKKHALKLDVEGNLVDTDNENEGWDHYVLDKTQAQALKKQIKDNKRPAMIWDAEKNQVCFYQEDQWSDFYLIKESKHLATRLFRLNRDPLGKILPQTSPEKYVLYSMTRKIATQTGQNHHYSPEYCFAQEFSHYYNEFAIYFPELGRLRELSKAVIITRILDGQRKKNLDNLEKNTARLYNATYWENRAIQIAHECHSETSTELSLQRQHTRYSEINRDVQERLQGILTQIGTVNYTANSPDIQNAAQELYEQNKQRIISAYGYNNWNQVSTQIWNEIQSDLPELAATLSTDKFNNFFAQLQDVFATELRHYSQSDKNEILVQFLRGSTTRLAIALVEYKKDDLTTQLHDQIFPYASIETIRSAMEGSPAAVQRIADGLVRTRIQNSENDLRHNIRKRERIEHTFVAMGLAQSQEQVDLAKICLWVPASINHQQEPGHNRLVYGGVRIAGSVNLLNQSNPALNNATLNSAPQGTKVYRVWGGAAGPNGQCWTTIKPDATNGNYRNIAGLPNSNTGSFVSEGILPDIYAMGPPRSAVPLHGNCGGLAEIRIVDPANQVTLTRVSGVNPPF